MARFLPAKWVWWYRDKRCAMGYSKRIYNDKKWNKTVAPLRPTFESLGLKEDDVARLHEQFLKIDKDGSGTIELWEMLDHLDLKRNRFAKRVFAIFDVDGSNEIDFKEFVVALWQYCTLGRAQLIMFAFDLYDRDSSGAIDFEEFNTMLKELYGPVWKSTSELPSSMASNRHAIEQTQLRRQHRVDGVGLPKFDFHTGTGGATRRTRSR